MKHIFYILFFLGFLSSIQAKTQSRVELTKIHSVTIVEHKIVIVGDGVFRSRLVTTEEGKDSNYVINGKPSAAYEAAAYKVTFILTPYQSTEIKPTFSEKVRNQVIQTNTYMAGVWKRTLNNAKELKEGGKAKFSIKGEEVIFKYGRLVSVRGTGSMGRQKKSEQDSARQSTTRSESKSE